MSKAKGATKDEGASGAANEQTDEKGEYGKGEVPEKPTGLARGKHPPGKDAGKGSKSQPKGASEAKGTGEKEGDTQAAATHQHEHTHHHEDVHVHVHAAQGDSQSVALNPHAGFSRPPMNPGGVVPMYTASQQGVTMNDSKPAGGAGLGSDRGHAANGGVRGRANPVKKGRG